MGKRADLFHDFQRNPKQCIARDIFKMMNVVGYFFYYCGILFSVHENSSFKKSYFFVVIACFYTN